MEKDFTKAIAYTAKILDLWLPLKIQYDRIPGLSVGLVHNGKLVYQRGFGYADVESKIPATPKTCYRIASISKTFTAVVIMQLVEQGKIRLDDQVEKHLPWFKAQNKGLDSSSITIRQLLSHTAGVFRDGDTPQWEDGKFPDIKGLQESISDKTLVFKNLTRFKYSNFGFAILGQVIKEVTGSSYNDYVTKHIIQKLGMKSTYPDFTQKISHQLAEGYSRPIPNKVREVFKHTATKSYSSAVGFISDVPDLAKYLSALSLNQKGKNVLLRQASKKKMMRGFKKTGEKNEIYGLGFNNYEIEGRKPTGHGGGFNGFITRIALDTENDIGVITLSNCNDSTAPAINNGIFATIYRFADKKNKYIKGKKLRNQEKYEGVYRSSWVDEVIVGTGANLIIFDPKTNSPLKEADLLRPKEKDTFVIKANSNFDSSGEHAQFIFGRGGKKAIRLILGPDPLERLKNSHGQ